MRIISLNAWGGVLHSPLVRYLGEAQADVLCLQEVTRTPQARSDWLAYRDHGLELPQRANLFDEIRAVLPDHDAAFFPAARGTLFEGERLVASEFGLATFTHTSLSVIGEAMDFVHGAFSPKGWGEHPRARNAHCLKLFDHASGWPVTIAQMHGLRDMAGKGDTPARRAQAEALVRLIERLWHPGERLVVCGDFNILPQSETFAILARLGLFDLVTARGFTDTRTSHYAKAGRFADYMLATPQVEILGFDVVAEPEVSDHRALLLDFR